ncbi:unnamed protein product, partial [Symbiodinium necroappetens]
MARNVSYINAPAAPMMPWRNEAPVVTMPPRQIYVMPLAVPPTPVSYPAHQSFWPYFPAPAQPVNVPLARPVAPTTRWLAPGPPKMEHVQAPMVQWMTNPVVSAP